VALPTSPHKQLQPSVTVISLVSCTFAKHASGQFEVLSSFGLHAAEQDLCGVDMMLWLSGVLHGNVNADTVWFTGSTENIQTKLAGFDESQYCHDAHHELARTTNQVQYRAPEVFIKKYLTSVDAWALGAVLYEAMAGHAAYQGTRKLNLILGVHPCADCHAPGTVQML